MHGRGTIFSSSAKTKAFILDFDGTITTKDTISTLAQFGISTCASKGENLSGAWEEIVAKYSEDFAKHIENYAPPKGKRDTLEKEILYYRSLRDVESRSFGRVSSSGLFRGIEKDEWEEFGREAVRRGEVIVRKGFKDFVKLVERSDEIWGVVSVNFSSHFIRGVLEASAGSNTSIVKVLANQPDEMGVLKGPEIEKGEVKSAIATSDSKLFSMKHLFRSWKLGHEKELSKVVYFGDSGTDIECLTEDGVIGIVISEDEKSSLMETLNRVGVHVCHISEYQEGEESVYWARNFFEVVDSHLLSPSTTNHV